MSMQQCNFCQRPAALRTSGFIGSGVQAAQPVPIRTHLRQSTQAAQALQGTVVSVASAKTAVVNVDNFVQDRIYKKQVRKTRKYQVHDENESAQVGDVVTMEPCRPFSRHKRFVVGKVLQKSTL